MTGPDFDRLLGLVPALAGARVVCVGDVMLDRFVYGDVSRISPEAPIPICRIRDETAMLGGAGNVVRNLVALGAAVAGSRPLIDAGWLPKTRQVGKSGMTVKPRVYLALGISGAPEHWEGMQNSQCIIAVNTDPKAPIFDGAHYGVVGDVLELLPVLTDKVKARKG